jgi:hypothetical protein
LKKKAVVDTVAKLIPTLHISSLVVWAALNIKLALSLSVGNVIPNTMKVNSIYSDASTWTSKWKQSES